MIVVEVLVISNYNVHKKLLWPGAIATQKYRQVRRQLALHLNSTQNKEN